MTEIIVHTLTHTLIDTLKTVPILFIVYFFIEWLEHRVDFSKIKNLRAKNYGPIFGALTGLIPQCGFSAASASLYSEKMITASTLIAVFLATSDEALPLLMSNSKTIKTVPILLLTKLVIAVLAGYALRFTFFKEKVSETEHHCHCHDIHNETEKAHHHHDEHHHDNHGDPDCNCCCSNTSLVLSALLHTLKITVFVFIAMLAINFSINFVGEEKLSSLLLSGSILQPLLTALLGLIPGCAGSVLITQLFINGTLSFGSAIAGLSAGCGFGYLILFKECKDKKTAFKILLTTYLISVFFGIIIHLCI